MGLSRATTIDFLIAFFTWQLSNMDQSMFGYAIPGLMTEFGINLDVVSLMISASFACTIVVVILMGVLTDLWGPRRTLPLCLGLSALLVGCQALASNVWLFAVLRILGYGFSGALSPITNVLAASAVPARLQAYSLAVLQCAYPLGWYTASLIVAPLLEHGAWREPFLVGFLVAPLALVTWLALGRTGRARGQPRDRARSAAPLRSVLGARWRRTTFLLAGTFLLYGAAIGGSTFFLPTYMHAARGYGEAEAARIVGLSYAIGIVGYLTAAAVSQTWLSRQATFVLWLVLGAVGFAAFLWCPPSPTGDLLLFGVTTMFLYGTTAVSIIFLIACYPEELRATANAVAGSAALSAGFVIAPPITGALVATLGWSWALTIIVVPVLLVAALLVAAVRAEHSLDRATR